MLWQGIGRGWNLQQRETSQLHNYTFPPTGWLFTSSLAMAQSPLGTPLFHHAFLLFTFAFTYILPSQLAFVPSLTAWPQVVSGWWIGTFVIPPYQDAEALCRAPRLCAGQCSGRGFLPWREGGGPAGHVRPVFILDLLMELRDELMGC